MSPRVVNAQLGRYVRRHREAKELSLRALAEATGVDYSTIARIELGEHASPNVEHLKRLARGLEVPAQDLFALAGYSVPEGLPDFAPYLRAKFDLPDRAVRELEQYFQDLRDKYGPPKGGRRGKRRA